MGGTLVELLKDVSFGHVPVRRTDAAEMLESLKCYPLLKGYRGSEGANLSQLEELVVRISDMLTCFPQIRELDINPLIFDPVRGKFMAVDFRVKIGKN